MTETPVEKQNRMLKILLIGLLIPIVAVISIFAYTFLTKTPGPNTVASNPANSAVPNNTQAVPSAQAFSTPNTPAPAATPTPTPTPTPDTSKLIANPVGKPDRSSVPFAGTWKSRGRDGTTYHFEAPKKIGSSEVGLMRVIAAAGKSYDSNYSDLDRKSSRFIVNGTEYFYEIEDNGNSLRLEYDGNIMTFYRVN